MTRKFVIPLIALFTALGVPAASDACPLCIAAQDESVQIAYIFATGFMTFLPLGLIGGMVFWLRRRARQVSLEDAAGVIRLPTASARAKTAV